MDFAVHKALAVGVDLALVFAEYGAGVLKVFVLAEVEAVATYCGLEI